MKTTGMTFYIMLLMAFLFILPGLSQEESVDRVQEGIAGLKSPDPTIRTKSALSLGEMSTKAKKAVPYLIPLLKDKDTEVRQHVSWALACIAPEGKEALPAIYKALNDEDYKVRAYAVVALGRFGPQEPGSIKVLPKMLADKNAKVRKDAAQAIKRVGVKTEEAMDALLLALKDEDPGVRKYSREAIEKLGIESREEIEAVAALLNNKNDKVREEAIDILVDIAPRAASALPEVIDALKDEDRIVRYKAKKLLQKLGIKDQPSAVALGKMLRSIKETPVSDSEKSAKVSAISLLDNIDPESSLAIPVFKGALSSSNPLVRFIAVGKLMKNTPRIFIPELIRAFRSSDPSVRKLICLALAKYALTDQPVANLLKKALEDKDKEVRQTASLVLGVSPPPEEADNPVYWVELLKDGDRSLRLQAASKLSSMGPQARSVIPLLLECARSEDREVRSSALRVLFLSILIFCRWVL